jgi:hypothetical protein
MSGQMKKQHFPPHNLGEWVEFCWLVLTDPVFSAAPNKRKAYFEYRLSKVYSTRMP